ncbi:MAG: hypothetical protein H6835_08395 [Planctomycetes bacterium]|nr:hypothetical protein [Planctomycetota bacterium]
MADNDKGAPAAGRRSGTALGAALGGVLGAAFGILLMSIGGDTPAAAAAIAPLPPTALVFEELDVARLASRDRDTGEWAVHSSAIVPDDVLAWLTARLGPVGSPFDPALEQRPLRGSMWRAMLPDSLELYICEELMAVARSPTFVLLLRDTTTGALAAQPPEFDARFHDMGVPKMPPRLHRVRLDDRAPWQLALRSYEHNGTMVNAETVVFFEPQRRPGGLELRDVLSFWTAMQWPFDDQELVREGGVFAASLAQVDGVLRLEEWYEHPALGTPRRPSARARYVREAAGEAFRMVDLQVLDAGSPYRRR